MAFSERFIRNIKAISFVATTVVAIAGAMAVFDLQVPRPAWAGEVQKLAAKVVELDSVVTSQQLDDAKLRLYQNQREQLKWDQSNGEVPEFLINERILLERKVDDLEDRLDDLREE